MTDNTEIVDQLVPGADEGRSFVVVGNGGCDNVGTGSSWGHFRCCL